MNYNIIPYKIGFGKTGEAKTGIKHALITETLNYQNAFEVYRKTCLSNAQPQDDKKNFMSLCNKHFLFEQLVKAETPVSEFILPNNEVLIFFNVDKLNGQRLNSLKCENYEIKL